MSSQKWGEGIKGCFPGAYQKVFAHAIFVGAIHELPLQVVHRNRFLELFGQPRNGRVPPIKGGASGGVPYF